MDGWTDGGLEGVFQRAETIKTFTLHCLEVTLRMIFQYSIWQFSTYYPCPGSHRLIAFVKVGVSCRNSKTSLIRDALACVM